MNTASPDSDPMFATHNPDLLTIWDILQRLQAELTFYQDLATFYLSPSWLRAKTVLDLGTGNGYYLRRLADRFPDKCYLGIDSSAELIAKAAVQSDYVDIEFTCQDLFQHQGNYDFVIMRLVLQHLDNLDGVLDKIAALTHPGASVLILDSYDPLRAFYPELPQFMRFFATYTAQQATNRRDRSAVIQVLEQANKSPCWKLGWEQTLIIPSTLPGNLAGFRQIYSLVIDMIEQVRQVQFDYAALRREWYDWCAREHTYAQVGVKAVRLDRI